MKITIEKAQCNNRRWRGHRSGKSLLLWLWPLFVGFYV